MKIKNLIVITICSLIFISCNSGWTEDQEREYKEACNQLNNTIEKQCNCSFDKFSNEYSYEQYSPSDENLSGYESSEEEIENAVEMNKGIRKCFE